MRTDAPSHEMVMSLLCSTAEKVHNQDLSALVTGGSFEWYWICESSNIHRGIDIEVAESAVPVFITFDQTFSSVDFVFAGLKGMGYCQGEKALVVSPRRTAGGKSNNRFCFQ